MVTMVTTNRMWQYVWLQRQSIGGSWWSQIRLMGREGRREEICGFGCVGLM
jgi:hypothetical protein